MSADQISRRQMLGAGSVLAVGALLGTPWTAGALPAVGSGQVGELLAILNRPNEDERFASYYETCECRACVAVRAGPYQCGACGFDGVPLVYPCECGKQWDGHVAFNAELLRTTTGPQWHMLAAFQRRLRRAGRPARCTPGTIQCAHTATSCPVCGDSGDNSPFEGEQDARSAAQMLRDLRAAVMGQHPAHG